MLRAPEGSYRESGPASFGPLKLDLELDLDVVADEHAARLEHRVPRHPEVRALDARPRRCAHSHVSPWIGELGGRTLHVECHHPRGSSNRQVTHDFDRPVLAPSSTARS